jgi:hypothetical protein
MMEALFTADVIRGYINANYLVDLLDISSPFAQHALFLRRSCKSDHALSGTRGPPGQWYVQMLQINCDALQSSSQ